MKQLLNLNLFRIASIQCFYTTLEADELLMATQFSSKMTPRNPLVLFYDLQNLYMVSNNKVIFPYMEGI